MDVATYIKQIILRYNNQSVVYMEVSYELLDISFLQPYYNKQIKNVNTTKVSISYLCLSVVHTPTCYIN